MFGNYAGEVMDLVGLIALSFLLAILAALLIEWFWAVIRRWFR